MRPPPFLFLFIAVAVAVAGTALAQPAPSSPALADSPWPTHHGGSAKQSSTRLAGPSAAEPQVQLRLFKEDAGELFGTSPFHVIGAAKYPASPDARSLWGASLTHVYKYRIDGDDFSYVDSFRINSLPFWVGWNLFGLDGDRVVVPNPSGLRLREHRGEPCYGKKPSLLVFTDGDRTNSPIRCIHKFEFTKPVLEAACGWHKLTVGSTPVINAVTFTGDVAVTLVRETREDGRRIKESWLGIIDNELKELKACARIGETTASNLIPTEPAAAGQTRLYVATDLELVEMLYDANENTLIRRAAVRTDYRARTGTTPTLLGFGDEDRFIISVDGRCATANVFSGAIRCAEDDPRPSQLVAIPRPLGSGKTIRYDLPAFIDTVENSPAVSGNDIVLANYTGYSPDGKKDGKRDFAKGIVKLSWNPQTQSFQTDWMHDDLQVNSIVTISDGAKLAYGSGAEQDGFTYFYAFRLHEQGSERPGELLIRQRVGRSLDSGRKTGDRVFDAGNNILINDDGSAIWPGGEVLVRIRDQAALDSHP